MIKFEKVTGYNVNLPERKTKGSAGYDIECAVDILLMPGQVTLVPTGVKAQFPEGYYLGVYLRSGFAKRYPVIMANSVGIIDSDYYGNPENEGHIHLMLMNFSNQIMQLTPGSRIGQLVLHKYYTADDEIITKERVGGFGSTGE